MKVKRDADKCTKYSRGMAKMAAGALSSIHEAVPEPLRSQMLEGIRHRSSLTASEQKRLAPTRLDKMEMRILEMLVGWSITDIECLLVHRVVPEAKRRAKVPE